MDPNQVLKNARASVARIDESITPSEEDVAALADAFEALDDWLSRGGFLPTEWSGLFGRPRR